jgi:hypothetical protein
VNGLCRWRIGCKKKEKKHQDGLMMASVFMASVEEEAKIC